MNTQTIDDCTTTFNEKFDSNDKMKIEIAKAHARKAYGEWRAIYRPTDDGKVIVEIQSHRATSTQDETVNTSIDSPLSKYAVYRQSDDGKISVEVYSLR